MRTRTFLNWASFTWAIVLNNLLEFLLILYSTWSISITRGVVRMRLNSLRCLWFYLAVMIRCPFGRRGLFFNRLHLILLNGFCPTVRSVLSCWIERALRGTVPRLIPLELQSTHVVVFMRGVREILTVVLCRVMIIYYLRRDTCRTILLRLKP